MKLKLEYLASESTGIVEALIVNGGAESVAGELSAPGQTLEVDVAVPQAVVLREKFVPETAEPVEPAE